MSFLLRVVFGTSTLISGLLYDGNERKLLRHALEGRVLLFASQDILDEVREVLARPKFRLNVEEQKQVFSALLFLCSLVEPKQVVKIVTQDPDDDKILECALEVKADYVVSGDHHLLGLKQFRDISIVRTYQLLTLLDSQA